MSTANGALPSVAGVPVPGPPAHLVRRFFSFLSARALDPDEQRWVAETLAEDEARLFWAQPIADQRHGHDCGRWVAERRPDRPDLVRAAVLHDVAKRHAGLGAIGRALATVFTALRIPGPASFHRYTRHGPIGAEELASVGAEPLVVAFTEHHHGDRPETIQASDWELLKTADHLT